MTVDYLQIGLVFGILLLTLVAFIREWAAPEVVAMSGFCLMVITGILSVDQACTVFSNPAPITIAAMFVLSAALEKAGLIDVLGGFLEKAMKRSLLFSLPLLMIVVASCSAFVNNTPVVAVMLPVILTISRKQHLEASRILIPLSYAAVLGGCCTLIGTSTNILVSGIATSYGMPALGMFEFAKLGLVFLVLGVMYVVVAGPVLLPDRASVTALLSSEDRRQYLCHLLINPDSPLVGMRLIATELADRDGGFRIIEVRRGGARSSLPLNEIEVQPFDRVLVAVSSRQMEKDAKGNSTLKAVLRQRLKLENLSTIKGAIIEGIVAPHSQLIGHSLQSLRFRQKYGMLVLAVHRQGKNVASHFHTAELEFGDTVLMLGPVSTFSQLRDQGDFTLLEDQEPRKVKRVQSAVTLAVMAGVVGLSACSGIPILFTALMACVLLMWMKYITPADAYKSIDWSIVFILYGMMSMGVGMETTGAAKWLAEGIVGFAQSVTPEAWLPIVALSLIYLMGSILTEVLSNNATAVIMAPIGINAALSLGLDVRPFVMAVAFSSSAAFSTPIGYQTHMMVYGAGGYKFSDFMRFGIPLNLLFWGVATWLIPVLWPLQ